MINTGCLTYGFVSSGFARRCDLTRISLPVRKPILGMQGKRSYVNEAARFKMDIDGHVESVWLYIAEGDNEYDIILGRPWLDRNEVTLAPAKKSIFIHSSNVRVRSREGKKPAWQPRGIEAPAFMALVRRSKKLKLGGASRVFAASMADI